MPIFADRPPHSSRDGYLAPAAEATAETVEKRSRFAAFVFPVDGEAAARRCLEALGRRHADANHHCWAWRLGPEASERAADAGEPAGTAGQPILQVLRGAELSDVLLVVVRWFGGIKLGKGGLARAYAGAARAALDELVVVRRVPTVDLTLDLPYDRLGAVKRLVQPPRVELVGEEYGAAVRLVLRVEVGQRAALLAALADLGIRPGAD